MTHEIQGEMRVHLCIRTVWAAAIARERSPYYAVIVIKDSQVVFTLGDPKGDDDVSPSRLYVIFTNGSPPVNHSS